MFNTPVRETIFNARLCLGSSRKYIFLQPIEAFFFPFFAVWDFTQAHPVVNRAVI